MDSSLLLPSSDTVSAIKSLSAKVEILVSETAPENPANDR